MRRKNHNENVEWINNMKKELELKEGSEANIHVDLQGATQENTKLENARP